MAKIKLTAIFDTEKDGWMIIGNCIHLVSRTCPIETEETMESFNKKMEEWKCKNK